MILDRSLLLADTAIITTSAASLNYIDTLAAGDAYVGSWFVVKTEATAFTAGNLAGICQFEIHTGDATTMDTTLIVSATFMAAALAANTELWKVRIPPGVKRYLRGYYRTLLLGTFATASYSMYIVRDTDKLISGTQ